MPKQDGGSRREIEGNKCADRRTEVGGVEDKHPVESDIDLRRLTCQLSHTVCRMKLLTFMTPLELAGADGVAGAAELAGAGGGPP